MASTKIPPIEEESPHSTPIFWPPPAAAAARRAPSISSSSRSNSWDSSFESPPFSLKEESPPYSPTIPLKPTGIPFSWEQTPGIPKSHHRLKKKEYSGADRLPLPPAGNTMSAAKKQQSSSRFKRDPFFAALIECSKDDDHDLDDDHDRGGFKINSRSLSDRFGFISMYSSCKTTCAISEAIVYVPRASPHYLLHRHRRRSS